MCIYISKLRRHDVRERGQSFGFFYLRQYLLVLDDVFIGGQQDIKLPAAELRHKPTAQSRSSLQYEAHKEKSIFFLHESAKSITISQSEIGNWHKKSSPYLISNFNHRGGPLIKLIDPVRQSPAKRTSVTVISCKAVAWIERHYRHMKRKGKRNHACWLKWIIKDLIAGSTSKEKKIPWEGFWKGSDGLELTVSEYFKDGFVQTPAKTKLSIRHL